MAPSSAAQWFGAVATFLAVIVALFRDFIWEWRRKPKLIVTCENSPPCTVRTPLFVNDLRTGNLLWTGDSYWVRVKVENKGRTRAAPLPVRLSHLYSSPRVDGEFSEDARQHRPLKLKWAHIGVPIREGSAPDRGARGDGSAPSDPANPQRPQLAK